MSKIIFMVGIPGSGKSTWARNYVDINKNAIILSRDALRRMRGQYMLPSQENMISKWMHACFNIALDTNEDVIIDNTNLKEGYYLEFLNILKNHKNCEFYEVYLKIVDIDYSLCVYRNTEGRPINERVPIDVVKHMYNNFIEFTKTENLNKFLTKHNINILL